MKLNHRTIGTGKPVLILHGLFGSSDNWQSFGKQLAEKGFQAVLIDLRNHGLSPHDNEFTFGVMAADVRELIDTEGLSDCIVMGHSLGGKTAMKMAELYPELLSALIVVDIAPRRYEVHHRQILDSLLSVDLSKVKTRSEAEEILTKGIPDFGTKQFLLKNLYWKEKDQLAWRFNLKILNEKIENVGESIKFVPPFSKPALFIKGQRSNYIGYEDEREIFELFSKVEIKTAPDAGHWVHADNPTWLLEVVVNFLNMTMRR